MRVPDRNRPMFQRSGWSFTWDPDKADENFKKHAVTFTEGATSFLDPHGLDGVDSEDPSREKLIAYSDQQRLLLTVYLGVDGDVIRIISARKATRVERRAYEEHARRGGRVLESTSAVLDGYRWGPNPYAASLRETGIRVLAEAMPRGARTFEDWKNRRNRPPDGKR
jgi:uncharacterized DUF497 family protein